MLYARYIINMFGEVFINNLLHDWLLSVPQIFLLVLEAEFSLVLR